MASIVSKTALKLSEKTNQRDGFAEYTIDGLIGGRVVVVWQIDEAEIAVRLAEASTDVQYPKGIGLDIEYKVAKGDVARPGTIQLSFPDVTLVFLVSQMGGKLPAALVGLFGNESYAKVGVAVKADAKMIVNTYGIPVVGCVELSVLAWRIAPLDLYRRCASPPGHVALSDLCSLFTDLRLHKDKKADIPDWNASMLDEDMICYAALDAIGSRLVYELLRARASGFDEGRKVWTLNLGVNGKVLDMEGNEWDVKDPLQPRDVETVVRQLKQSQKAFSAKELALNNRIKQLEGVKN